MIKKLALIMLGTVSAVFINTAFSYNIYNTTKVPVRVVDDSVGGLKATIAPNSFVSCNPKARGCYGKMRFSVYSKDSNEKIAGWKGTLDNSTGHYFIINFSFDEEDGANSYYGMEHYHD